MEVPLPRISSVPAMEEVAVVEVAMNADAERRLRAVRLVTVDVALLLVIFKIVSSTAWRLVLVPVTVLVMPPAVVI